MFENKIPNFLWILQAAVIIMALVIASYFVALDLLTIRRFIYVN